MQKIVHKLPLAAVIVSASLLAGCGGSSDSITPATSGSTSSLSGTAAKGIIKQALVTAEELVGTSWVTRGTATTDNNGDYTLTMSGYTNGVVRVTVTPTANTLMVCDAPSGCINIDGSTTAFGADATLPTDFNMKAVVPPVTAAESVAYITPLTDMVAANLEQAPANINTDSIKQKSAQVAGAFGLGDILRTKPIDITKGVTGQDSAQQSYAVALSTIAEMIKSSSTTAANTTQALAKIRDSFKDGKFDSADSFSGNKDMFSSILETKTAVINNNVISGKIDAAVKTVIVNDNSEKTTSYKPSEGGYTPPVVETAVASDIDRAKSILSQARALQTSINSMQNPAQSFSTQLNTVSNVWNDRSSSYMIYLTEIIKDVSSKLGGEIKGAVNDIAIQIGTTSGISCYPDANGTLTMNLYNSNTQTTSLQKASCGVYENNYNMAGTPTQTNLATVKVSVADNSEGLKVTVSKVANTNGSDLAPKTDLIFTIPNFTTADLAKDSITRSAVSLKVSGSLSDTRANLTFNDLMTQINFDNAYTAGSTVPEGTTPIFASAFLKGAISFVDNQTSGSFIGNIDASAIRPSTHGIKFDTLSLSKIALDGNFTSGGSSVKAAATFNLTNAASFDLTAFTSYEKTKYVYAGSYSNTPLNLNTSNIASIATQAGVPSDVSGFFVNYYNNGYSYFNGQTTVVIPNNSTCFNYYTGAPTYTSGNKCVIGDVLGFADALKTQVPNAMSFTLQSGSYSPASTGFSGYSSAIGYATFPDFESATNFAQGNLTLSLDANLAGFPNTVATVTIDRSGYPDIGSAVLSLKQQTVARGITISATNSVANGMSNINALTVTSLDGTTMTLNKSATGGIQGKIKVGSTEVADIIDMKGWTKVSFKDGTFESF